jgi:DNA-binding beta-propeller fold protein YncE
VFVANTGSTTVVPVNVESWTAGDSFDVGADAHGISLSHNGEIAFISNRGSGSVTVVNIGDGKVVKVLEVGTAPDGMWWGPPPPSTVVTYIEGSN